jgi:hypothetical protein
VDRTEHDAERRQWLDRERDWLVEVFVRANVFGRHQDSEHRLRAAYERARARCGLTRRYII